MATLRVLSFDTESRPIQFESWLDDLQLFLLSDSKDNVSLFDHTSGASVAPAATAELSARSQWQTHDAAARLAVRSHLPLAELPHFGEHKTAKALDHFLARCPTDLTVDLLEEHLLAAETGLITVGAARGAPRTPIFEGCSPSPLAPSYATAAAEVEKEEVAEGVVAGMLAGVVASVAAVGVEVEVVAAEGVAAAMAAAVAVGAAVAVAVEAEALALARDSSSSSVPVRLLRPSSFVSGLLSVGRLGVVVVLPAASFVTVLHPHHSLHLLQSLWLTPQGAEFLHACGDLYVLPDRPPPGHLYPSARVESLHTDDYASSGSCNWYLPPLPPSPAPPCLPCVEEQQRAAPHSSSFPPTEARLQTLHMDVWGPACVRGQGGEWYFLLVVNDYPLRYVAQQLNLWPRVSLPETSPTLRWTGEVGDVSVFRVWGVCALVRDTSAVKLSSRTIPPCVFFGFPPDAPGWQFYHPTSRSVLSSQYVTFDEMVPFDHRFPYRTAPLPPPPLFLAPGPPPIDPLPTQGPAPSGVSQEDPLPLAKPVEVTSNSGAAAGGAA
ncbi:unnamed protein product [Closterium sp. NIES-65]|nr:unnamed protein product [Closterium sp. NIES-65]